MTKRDLAPGKRQNVDSPHSLKRRKVDNVDDQSKAPNGSEPLNPLRRDSRSSTKHLFESGEQSASPSRAATITPLPEWLSSGLSSLQKQFPEDSFYGTVNGEGAPRVACSDCPGTLYFVDDSSVSKFQTHLRNKKHRDNVSARLRLSTAGRTSLGPGPPSLREQMHDGKAASSSSTPSQLNGEGKGVLNGKESTPILPSSSKPILPTDRPAVVPPPVTQSQIQSPGVRIAALEKALVEKSAQIEALEEKWNEIEMEQKRQADILAELAGKMNKSNGVVPSKRGLGSFFDIFSSPAT